MLKCSIASTCRMMLFILTHNACELNESKKLSTADDAKNLLYQFSFNASQSMCVESECTAGCPELKNTSFRSTAAHRMELGRTIVDILVSACCCCWTDEWVQFDDLTVSVCVYVTPLQMAAQHSKHDWQASISFCLGVQSRSIINWFFSNAQCAATRNDHAATTARQQ